MRLPAQLLRPKKNVYKNQFGHVLVIAGSPKMAGAAALCSLAAIRSGAGLVTAGIPASLNPVVQKKLAPVIMTLPLPETPKQTVSHLAYREIKKKLPEYACVAVGPGLSQEKSTKRFVRTLISQCPVPLVIDADALNALAEQPGLLRKSAVAKILTPHPGEMARLTGLPKAKIESDRKKTAAEFAQKYNCVLLLKGPQTVVASPDGEIFLNTTGTPGMATAGSGDVLTGMIAAFLAQGVLPMEAAVWGAIMHGEAGEFAAKDKTPTAMIASDIIESIPQAFKKISAAH